MLTKFQVWPSSDSPRGEADGQSFVFPPCADDAASQHSLYFEGAHNPNDSGIESTQVITYNHHLNASSFKLNHELQVSPSPLAFPSPLPSPTPSLRRPSSALLHPDHARFFRAYHASSPDHTSIEDVSECQNGHIASPSSSTTSSLTSVAAAVAATTSSRSSDPCDSRRRSSTMTARYSLFDALDLEYALLRAAARGSVGPYSLSESLHKLTFTQSLAFPALARGLASKRRRSQQNASSRPLDPAESGLNAFAKVVTALVLVLVSVLVFAVVYKFVRT